MLKPIPTLTSALPNLLVDGSIFKHLPLYGDMTAPQMGILYAAKKSGSSKASSLVRYYLGTDGHVTSEGEAALGLMLTNIYKNNWDRQWEALQAEYEILDNVTEHTENEIKHTGYDEDIFGNKRHVDGEQKINYADDVVHDDAYVDEHETLKAAYDDPNYSPDAKVKDDIPEHKTTRDAREDTYGQKVITDDSYSDKHHKGTTDKTIIDRHGNIGVTSSQQMITQELELRKYDFFDEMFNDIDKYLCLHVR